MLESQYFVSVWRCFDFTTLRVDGRLVVDRQTSTKLMEAQSKIGTLDSKILKLQFALHREVGDQIPIQKVATSLRENRHFAFQRI